MAAPIAPSGPGPRAGGGRALRLALGAGLCILTLVTFGELRAHPFISYDDTVYVTENPHVQEGLTAGSVAWAFTATAGAHWHPVTWLSHMLDVELFGLDPGRHHLVSLLIHTMNALLLFLLLDRITAAPLRSVVVAALFAVHPLHVESVAWVAERKDVLSTFFGLLTLIAWCAFIRSRRTGTYLLACALFALALLSKPMLVTLPFAMLLLDVWPLGRLRIPAPQDDRSRRALLVEKIPFFALSAASCVATVISSRVGRTLGNLETYTLADRVSNAAAAYSTYLGKAIWPASLAIFYPHRHGAISAVALAGGVAVVLGLAALAVVSIRRAPWVTFGVLWYLGTLVPVVGLVQVGGQSMADRYTYVPLIGVFVAVVWSLAALAQQAPRLRAPLAVGAATAILVLSLATRAQLAFWRSNEALYTRALQVTEGNWVAYNNLGLALFDEGRKDEAIASYRQAIRYLPAYQDALANLGFALADRGDLAGAATAFNEALELDPDDPKKHFQMAFVLGRSGKAADAISHYERAVALDPGFAEAHGNLANLLDSQGRTAEAIAHYEASLRIRPRNPIVLYNLGNALLHSGRIDEAIARLGESVRLRPDLAEAHNALGSALRRAGRLAEARAEIEAALRLKPGYPSALRNLRRVETAGEADREGDE